MLRSSEKRAGDGTERMKLSVDLPLAAGAVCWQAQQQEESSRRSRCQMSAMQAHRLPLTSCCPLG